jgi:myxalamid-type polyketide synthase MxaC
MTTPPAPTQAAAPIAVVGMACRFPGAPSIAAFWRLLTEGRDAIGEVPPLRWDANAWFDADPSAPGRMTTRRGGFVDGIDRFDAGFFHISRREAERMDPQQRMMLEVAWDALESAALTPARLGARTGVFVGAGSYDYGAYQVTSPERADLYSGIGSSLCIIPARISYQLDLRGPSLAVDTACSSSLVAAILACRSIWSGESDAAIIGGVNVVLLPGPSVSFSKGGFMAPDGRCKTFDARADGYVRGEGAGAAVLRPLDAAIASGDPILAVIRGGAMNQDGLSNGITAPNVGAQIDVLRCAYASAGVSPRDVDYVELHGTGTLLGDRLEAAALGAVVGAGRSPDAACAVGSVKSNVGHLEAAAGIAGLIKTVLAIQHGVVPASLHFSQPNPHIDFDRCRLRLVARTEPWRSAERPRRAGVSSFGWGGTNAHLVLEQAPPAAPGRDAPAGRSRKVHALAVTAKSSAAVFELASRYADHLEAHPEVSVEDVLHTANVRRAHHQHRRTVIARSRAELVAGLRELSARADATRYAGAGRVAFVFPGYGGQAVPAGRELLDREPVFREAIAACAHAMRDHVPWSLVDLLAGSDPRATVETVDVVQPVLFGLQVGLVALWRSWGVEPDAVVGHSMGEIAAAHAAGALSLNDAARVICVRSRLLKLHGGRGAMLYAELSTDEAREAVLELGGRLALAAINGPRSVVLSGESAEIAALRERLEQRHVFCRRIPVDYASHGPMMEPICDELRQLLVGIEPRRPRVPLVSTVAGAGDQPELGPDYWAHNLRQPVMFHRAARQLRETGRDVFVEISVHPALLSSIEDALSGPRTDAAGDGPPPAVTVASLRRDRSAEHQLAEGAGRLYELGCRLDWSRIVSPGRVVELPAYPWQHERYWFDGAAARSAARSDQAQRTGSDPPFLARRWIPASPPASRAATGERWLLLGDDSGFAARLGDPLRRHGIEVVAQRGAAGEPRAGTRFDHVVHVSSMDVPDPAAITPESLARIARRDCGALLSIARELVTAPAPAAPLRLTIVTRGAESAGVDRTAHPLSAMVAGLGRTIAVEHPELACSLVDLAPAPGPAADEVELVVAELVGEGREDQVALRGDGRFVARIARLPAPTPRAPGPWTARPDATYLVTGGCGALGSSIASWLVDRGARHLVLVGRSGASSPEAAGRVARLRERGADVLAAAADVADRAALSAVLANAAERMPPLRGVIHAAGVIDDALVVDQTLDRLEAVARPKVIGAWNLHALTAELGLDLFVLYSSAASLLGSPGQSGYAAANAFMDALAHHRRALGLPALSINWGPFAGAGLAAAAARARRFEARGVRSFAIAESTELMAALVEADVAQIGVIDLDVARWFDAHPHLASAPLWADLSGAGSGAPRPDRAGELRDRLATATDDDRPAIVERIVRDCVAGVLRASPGALPTDAPFQDAGLDSLGGLELRRRLEAAVGVALPASAIWTHPTIGQLAGHLAEITRPDRRPAAITAGSATTRVERSEMGGGDPAGSAGGAGGGAPRGIDRPREPIAIVGMACRFPGAPDLDAFWRMLVDGADAVRRVPATRWPEGAAGRDPGTGWAALLDEVRAFDAGFFGIAPREARAMDPQQRLLLEVTADALDDAGLGGGGPGRTGVFVALGAQDYLELARRAHMRDAYVSSGNMISMAAGRLAHMFGFDGPTVCVDTACSSSLVATHLACRSLRSGETDQAIIGGVNLILSSDTMALVSKTLALSPDGRTRAFDARAAGFVRGEGCGVIVLRRLADAVGAGDRIWAVVRGSAVNQTGRSAGLGVPSAAAQETVIRAALADAEVDASEIGYIEAHGTATTVGDVTELEALSAVFGGGRGPASTRVVGTAKANIGHLEAAAGVAAVIKVALSLHHQRIPRQPHLETVNPEIRARGAAGEFATSELPWPASRLAGVSQFGFSGTGAHVVMDAAPAADPPRDGARPAAHLLPLSARTETALRALATRHAQHIAARPDQRLDDICFTASTGRAALARRVAIIARSRDELCRMLDEIAARPDGLPAVVGDDDGELSRIGRQFASGGTVDWRGVYTGRDVRRISLPSYPWERREFWIPNGGHDDHGR